MLVLPDTSMDLVGVPLFLDTYGHAADSDTSFDKIVRHGPLQLEAGLPQPLSSSNLRPSVETRLLLPVIPQYLPQAGLQPLSPLWAAILRLPYFLKLGPLPTISPQTLLVAPTHWSCLSARPLPLPKSQQWMAALLVSLRPKKLRLVVN